MAESVSSSSSSHEHDGQKDNLSFETLSIFLFTGQVCRIVGLFGSNFLYRFDTKNYSLESSINEIDDIIAIIRLCWEV
ncbi:hypothetical protein pipiens_007299 [Culex pipiens pipiens]|uniref:Uncharacterized protein n=1 Tax=Culex pipiens pipiens TaxID=38569 RepID=A0ABD1DQD6_CULPP